ncbi:MAG: hypothetical protein NTU44_17780 [Bacteroidetes bacterium]|nr:hypothetical protein [Bacteroidota bacterium]
MKQIITFFLLSFLFSLSGLSQNTAPVISNFSVIQRQNNSFIVDIQYDVSDADGNTMTVTMKVSDDNGLTWNYPFNLAHVSGDIGSNINSGTGKHIIWYFGIDHPDTLIANIKIKIIADDGYIPFNCGGSFTDDRNGQVYSTVFIGGQCWMRQNLNIGTRITGSAGMSDNKIIEKYCYSNDESKCSIYGGLYQWGEAMNYSTAPVSVGICPDGWHLPSDDDFCTLAKSFDATVNCFTVGWMGTNAGGKLKETGTNHWNSPNTGATNESGFTALGAGYRSDQSLFQSQKGVGGFVTTSDYSSSRTIGWETGYNGANIGRISHYKAAGFSIRCIKDTCAHLPTHANAGPDQFLTDTSVTILSANAPIFGQGEWNIVSGNGGAVAQVNNPNSVFNGAFGVTYSLTWRIITPCMSYIDTVIIIIRGPCPGLPSINYGGQDYATVRIGTQCWMKENLNIGTYESWKHNQTDDGVIEKYCYGDNQANCNIYGGLYLWNEMMQYSLAQGVQGICPAGWHIPTDAEWCTLSTLLDLTVDCNYVGASGTDAGGKLKETGTMLWSSPNAGATNETGFSALPGGYKHPAGGFSNFNALSIYWSSTYNGQSYGINLAFSRSMKSNTAKITRGSNSEATSGYSVRCIKNN